VSSVLRFVLRGLKILITFPSAALAVFLSSSAITAFLLLTGTNLFVALGGTAGVIAMWLGFAWVVVRLSTE
jgi:hypothetical protein